MSSGAGFATRLWYRWKALKLPWRRQFLVGGDLAGNTYWEFKDALNSNRFRRIMKYGGRGRDYSDVKISPQWHQWLRHTRDDAPSIEEQQYDISRQVMMKQLAAQADERWKSVPSYLDSPAKQQPAPALEANGLLDKEAISSEDGSGKAAAETEQIKDIGRGKSAGKSAKSGRMKRDREDNPFNRPQTGAPGEKWQPEAWSPGVAQRR